MVATFSDRFGRVFKTVCARIRSHTADRKPIPLTQIKKLIPWVYLFLSVSLAIQAHSTSQQIGIQEWLSLHPPTLGMVSGELIQRGLFKISDEPTSRKLYRSFPFKNAKSGSLYYSPDSSCIAITSHPETSPVPLFYCLEITSLSKSIKREWRSLGHGWSGVGAIEKLTFTPKKPIQKLISYDPREIRY